MAAPAKRGAAVRELWGHKNLDYANGDSSSMPGHGVAMSGIGATSYNGS